MVRPAVVWRRGLYTLSAIAGALAAWSLEGRSAREVRRATSPLVHHGAHDAARWRSLWRWAEAPPFGPKVTGPLPRAGPRLRASEIARRLIALVPISTGSLSADAFFGAAHTR